MTKIYTKPSAVIFDFDDTLVDARPIINKALFATLDKFNVDRNIIDLKNIDINRSLRDYFCHIFVDNLKEAAAAYYSYYDEFSKDLKMLEGAEEVLKLLKNNKVFITIVSNKGGVRLRHEIKNIFSWHNYFDEVVGSGDAKEDKPSSLPAKLALKNSNLLDYKDVWFIGDSMVDVETANNLGCKAILFGSIHHDVYHNVANHKDLLKLFRDIYV